MATIVVYWTDYDIGEKVHQHPIVPHAAVEFPDLAEAVKHLKADYYGAWKDSHDVYFYSFHGIKHFAKVLESKPPEPPRKSLYPPGTITY